MASPKKKPKPMHERGDVVVPLNSANTLISLTSDELRRLEALPLCPHGRRVGFAPCPHCLGLNS